MRLNGTTGCWWYASHHVLLMFSHLWFGWTTFDTIRGELQVFWTHSDTFFLIFFFYFTTFDLFWTIAKPSHRDYFELHRMQINIYRTIVELGTLTTDTKLFTTLWIVQNHTNTALIIESLALSPFKDSVCVCCPLMGDCKNWQHGMLTKTFAQHMNVTILKLNVAKLNPVTTPGEKQIQSKSNVGSMKCGYVSSG